MSFIHNLKKTFIVFSVEITILAIGYCIYVIWNGYLITEILIGDILFWAFLVLLFVLDYFIVSTRQKKEEDVQNKVKQNIAGSTKKEQTLKYLRVIGNLSSKQLASLLEIDVRNLSKFINPLIQTRVIEAKKTG